MVGKCDRTKELGAKCCKLGQTARPVHSIPLVLGSNDAPFHEVVL